MSRLDRSKLSDVVSKKVKHMVYNKLNTKASNVENNIFDMFTLLKQSIQHKQTKFGEKSS